MSDFPKFPKIHRLSREMIVTEKIDGTNASVHISEDGDVRFGSRTRFITPGDDNRGFARWGEANKTELLKLGPGVHYGEWWGQGIQRGYGLKEKVFSLFNVSRWSDPQVRPACCGVVPVLHVGPFDSVQIDALIVALRLRGSQAALEFMRPEGVVVFHVPSGALFKKLLENDELSKGEAA